MGKLIYINGAPGVGKLTIARCLARHLSARILDNHAIYNVGFALADFGSEAFFDAVRAVRAAAYQQISRLSGEQAVILTAADFHDNLWGQENWNAVADLAVDRKWPLFAVSLRCSPVEHRNRMVSEDRERRGKLRDADAVARLSLRPLVQLTGSRILEMNVTNLSAEEAAVKIAEWMDREP